ncbi:hypothetical protein [Sulfurimonas sp.]
MLKIDEIYKIKLFVLLILTIISTALLSYIIQNYIDSFFTLWLFLSFAFLVILFSVFYIIKKKNTKIMHDIEQITNYLDEISNKNYQAIVKTEHFSEFLHISVKLKNMVKRLHKYDTQKQKKS